MPSLKRFGIDPYLLMLIATVILAALLPARGWFASIVGGVGYFAVALLFFLYGAKLKTQAVVAGLANWRLQLLVFAATFLLFPLFGIALSKILGPFLLPELITGIMFLAVLPSTVQSSIALTSVAGGNVPAAICAASLSNLLGVIITPVLAALLLQAGGVTFSIDVVISIAVQLLLPFVAGQLLRRWIGAWVESHETATGFVDRGTILLIVYSAFSASVVQGVWGRVEPLMLAIVIVVDLVLLFAVIGVIVFTARRGRLPREDRITGVFCGATKSMASGIPIANVIFGAHPVGIIILPLMLFHQLQLFVFAFLAAGYARTTQEG
jgi:sodium/bile acid cotransporter 7